jgi:ABC-type glycerol-3-phosphate transport system substrate-binding protein
MNLRPFQILILGTFGGLAVLALVFLMFYKGSTVDPNDFGNVSIWGTLDGRVMRDVLAEASKADDTFHNVNYTQKDPRTFDNELLNAIAESRSPDLIILPHDALVMHRAKLVAISYDTISERDFRDLYVDGAGIFMRPDGIYGIPFAIDPLVMYWNRDIFSSGGVALPPTTWESLAFNTVPALTRINNDRTITQSAVALGEYSNIRYAKEILSMLFLQSGSTIVNETDRGYAVDLSGTPTGGGGISAADAAISFYTQFATPSNSNYTWSRSFGSDRLEFLGGSLGMYFGLGSELTTIRRENPNLNFDIAPVPQGAGATVLRNYGVVYAFSIPNAAANKQGAFKVAQVLSGAAYSDLMTSQLGLAPAMRSIVEQGTADSYRHILFQSALIARGWLDPNPPETAQVFRQLVEDVTSGRSRVTEAIADTTSRLRLLFR